MQPAYGVSTATQLAIVQPVYGVLTSAVHAGTVQPVGVSTAVHKHPAYGASTSVQA